MKELIDEIDKQFSEALEEKDNWTPNEIQELYTKVKNKVYLEYLDKTIGK